jgi:hypothetical protein
MRRYQCHSRRAFLTTAMGGLILTIDQPFDTVSAVTALATSSLPTIRPIRIGGGGYITGFDQHLDGTLVCRTDTYGAYLWSDETQSWSQLLTTLSMPAGDNIRGNEYSVFEICIAPTNSKIFYMICSGRVYKSLNRGSTWEQTNFTRVDGKNENMGEQRCDGAKMAIDPLDANVVYCGTLDDGLFRTLDGGLTWSLLTGVPIPSGSADGSEPGVSGIIFDPISDSVSGRTAVLWASSYGYGYFRTIDGGNSWSKPAGGPSTAVRRAGFSSSGKLFCTEHATAKAWRWDGLWTDLGTSVAGGDTRGVACDPFDSNRVIFSSGGGGTQETLDAGVTFNPLVQGASVRQESSKDVAWLEMAFPTPYMPVGEMKFDRRVQNRLIFTEGVGVWTAIVPPNAVTNNWHSMTEGIEQLVPYLVCATPNGNLFLGAMDRPFWKVTNPDAYPSSYFIENSTTIDHGSAIDYLSSNPDILAKTHFVNGSGYSTDGGDTWTQFTSPTTWGHNPGGGGGEIVVLSEKHFIWVPTNKKQPHCTSDAGRTWTGIALPGVTNDEAGWEGTNWAYYLRKRICTADRVIAGTAYLYHAQIGLFTTTDYGENWTLTHPGPVMDWSGFNAKLRSPDGHAGHLWFTSGDQSDSISGVFKHSTDGGATWTTIPDVLEVKDFGFGKAALGASYPTIWIAGWVKSVWGIYYSIDEGVSWVRVADHPLNSLDSIVAIDGDKLQFGRAYLAFAGSGWAYISIG